MPLRRDADRLSSPASQRTHHLQDAGNVSDFHCGYEGCASPFNAITEAMTLRNFTADEVKSLYQQHTDATGQVFEDGVAELAFEYSCGQPWEEKIATDEVVLDGKRIHLVRC